MSHYRRPGVGGAIYFFTVVTYGRQPVLIRPPMRRALREALTLAAEFFPCPIIDGPAWVGRRTFLRL
jgi:REP element-mobilizing transposase RayT